MSTSPIYAWPAPYITGLGLTYIGNTTLALGAGSVPDSRGNNIITVPGPVVINSAVVGAGGIDTGALAANTLYAVYAIGNSYSYAPTLNDESDALNPFPGTGIISTNFVRPSMPADYDMHRYVGAVLTDGSSNILKFFQTGNGKDRTMWYDAAVSVLAGGTSATYANVDLSAAVPAPGLEVLILAALTPTAASNGVNLIPYSSTATVGYAVLTGDVGAVAVTSVLRLPCSTNAGDAFIKYKVAGSVNLGVAGYIDQI